MLLFISSFSFSQNWSDVGALKFTNFAEDARMVTHPTTGEPYIIYTDIQDSKKPFVLRFNGTSWVNVGSGAIINFEAKMINIAFNPSNNELNAVFKNSDTGKVDLYKFDGTNWVAIATSLTDSEFFIDDTRLQIFYDASNAIHILGNHLKTTGNKRMARYFVNAQSSWAYETSLFVIGDSTATAVSEDEYLLTYSSVVYQYTMTGTGIFSNSSFSNSLIKESTSIDGGDYWAATGTHPSFSKVYVSHKNESNFTQPNNTETNIDYLIDLEKDNTLNRLFLMYSDSNDELQIQRYTNTIWNTILPTNIDASTSNFFSQIKFNETDGSLYLMFLDGGKLSVKKYQPIQPLAKYYVNANATSGDGSGSSWANAATDLNYVLNNSGANTTEIWVAGGVYNPGASRSESFNLRLNNLQLFGGFKGTETSISERDITNNPTILSGDISRNDTAVDFATGLRGDNSYHVVKISANNILLDGFKIEDGHATGSATNAYGGGLYVSDSAKDMVIKNCEFNNNTGLTGGALRVYYNTNTSATIENCTFSNNVSRYGSGLYFLVNNNRTVTLDITNCLFVNNTSKDRSFNDKGYTGSAAWIRANGSGSNLTTTITNSTFANNTDIGTFSTSERGTLGLSKRTDGSSTHNVTINNSIFYGNEDASGDTTASINKGHVLLPDLTLVNNSIGEDGFSNLTYLTNTSNADPMFVDVANKNYRIQSGSPAKDTGDNSKVPTGITNDLFFNPRITDTTVDMGPFEYCTSCKDISTLVVNIQGHGSVSNPGGTFTLGSSHLITAIPDKGYVFSGFIGDITSTDNPLAVTLSGSILTITANFIEGPVYVNANATGDNDGTSWVDAYTDLQDAVGASGKNIWVAKGTYKPGTSRSDSFVLETESLSIYGGFNGTETLISERDVLANPTILSGDLNEDDTDVDYTTASRTDNSYHIVKINANDIVLDGLTIQDGHANGVSGTANNDSASAIFKTESVNALNLKNCTIKNNVSLIGGTVRSFFDINGTVNVENCIFQGNVSTYASSLYVLTRNNVLVDVTIVNSLFAKNTSKNNGSTLGYTGSSAWIRGYGSGSTVTTNIVNTTFANNTDSGTQSALIDKGTLSLSRASGTHNATISNSIFFNNEKSSGVVTSSVSQGHESVANTVVVKNSIAEDNFYNLTSVTNISNANPLFKDAANNDFTLQASSPAIDAGDNSLLPTNVTLDLLGNQRIYNTTVDMGAYESGFSPLSTESLVVLSDAKVYPNPVRNNLYIKSKENILKIEVYNLLGKKIVEKENSNFIDLSNLKSSMYLIRVHSKTSSISKRILKN